MTFQGTERKSKLLTLKPVLSCSCLPARLHFISCCPAAGVNFKSYWNHFRLPIRESLMDVWSLSAVTICDRGLDSSLLPIWSLPLHPFLLEVSGLLLVGRPPLAGPPLNPVPSARVPQQLEAPSPAFLAAPGCQCPLRRGPPPASACFPWLLCNVRQQGVNSSPISRLVTAHEPHHGEPQWLSSAARSHAECHKSGLLLAPPGGCYRQEPAHSALRPQPPLHTVNQGWPIPWEFGGFTEHPGLGVAWSLFLKGWELYSPSQTWDPATRKSRSILRAWLPATWIFWGWWPSVCLTTHIKTSMKLVKNTHFPAASPESPTW